ncbi:MAG: hypothetical protein GYA24_20930 [Candidatus Lokiarchaeota archaeon]|nr:hypothetical protein [Candidatus Lokiarchaeota archaeon]
MHDIKPFPNGIASQVFKAIPGSITLCEPLFGHASIILSRGKSPFKVHVLNDPGRGLVQLFEMVRVDEATLRSLLAREDPRPSVPSFAGRSAFFHDAADLARGMAAFHCCIENMGIDHRFIDACLASNASFKECISTIHEKLVHVLVESMPARAFIQRFDKPYTTFFIPHLPASIDGVIESMRGGLAGLRGHLVIETVSRQELEDVLGVIDEVKRFTLIDEIHASDAGIGNDTDNTMSRLLFVLTRA